MKFLARGQISRSDQGRPSAGQCRRIRQRLVGSMLRRVGPEAPWVQKHVAHCPRCQRRLAAVGKVDLALSIIKSQPQQLNLLMRANSAALRMLSHDLREAAAAQELERAKPEPGFLERCARYRIPVRNVAACITILFLSKVGIFSSFSKVHARGEEALKQYYTTQAGEEVAREIFGA